jgi:hypothetical protein
MSYDVLDLCLHNVRLEPFLPFLNSKTALDTALDNSLFRLVIVYVQSLHLHQTTQLASHVHRRVCSPTIISIVF